MGELLPSLVLLEANGRGYAVAMRDEAVSIKPWEVVFSLKTFVAAMLALWLAFSFDLQNPFWAVGTVYIVAQPLAGASTSKAFYRLLGTLLGGIASVVLIPNLVNAPILLITGMSIWLGGCLAVSLLDRSPRSYIFMLAGYTTAIIGFPILDTPSLLFTNATNRVTEICLGIICTAVISRVFVPRHAGPVLADRIEAWMGNCASIITSALNGNDAEASTTSNAKVLAAEAVDLRSITTFVAYDTSDFADSVSLSRELQRSMLALLPMTSGLAGVTDALSRATDGELTPKVRELIKAFTLTLSASEPMSGNSRRDLVRLEGEAIEEGAMSPLWHVLLIKNFVVRMRDVLDLWSDCLVLKQDLLSGSRRGAKWNRFGKLSGNVPIHRDYGVALYSGLSASLAVVIASVTWIYLGWPQGAGAATMAAIVACIFSSVDQPAPLMAKFLQGVVIACVLSFIVLFGVMPALHGFIPLAASLGLVLIPAGVLIARPKTLVLGLGIASVFPNMLALQTRQTFDLESFLNGNVGLVAGVVFAWATSMLVRSISSHWMARRLLHASWADISRVALRGRGSDYHALSYRMLDRFGLLASRQQVLATMPDLSQANILRDLRNGLNSTVLERHLSELPAEARENIRSILDGIGELYARRQKEPLALPLSSLLSHLNAGIANVLELDASPAIDEVRVALVGIRYNLFPDVTSFDFPSKSAPSELAA